MSHRGYERKLLGGLAADLDDGDVATWRPTGTYQAGETAIVLEGLRQAPDRLVSLAAYGVDESPNLSDSVIGVQVTTRWDGQDPTPGMDLADAIFDRWHGRTNLVLATGVEVVQLLRRSAVTGGQDENHRWRRIQNFYATVHRPSPHRL